MWAKISHSFSSYMPTSRIHIRPFTVWTHFDSVRRTFLRKKPPLIYLLRRPLSFLFLYSVCMVEQKSNFPLSSLHSFHFSPKWEEGTTQQNEKRERRFHLPKKMSRLCLAWLVGFERRYGTERGGGKKGEGEISREGGRG